MERRERKKKSRRSREEVKDTEGKRDWTAWLKKKPPKKNKRRAVRENKEDRLERTPRGLRFHLRRELEGLPFGYMKWKHNVTDDPLRWYYVGKVKVAFMQIFPDNHMREGNVQVRMNSIHSNSGRWFETIKEAEKAIRLELRNQP
jgi:hypothetical protein